VAGITSGRQANGETAREGNEGVAGPRDNEFEGLFGLLAGWSMSFGRGPSTRLVADLAGVRAGDRVVDVGCGPGLFLKEAAQRGATAVGVDPSTRMRGLALRRIPAGLRSAVTVVDGTAEQLPLEDGSATVAWAVGSLHHWNDPDAGLAEVCRVLAPGGRLLVAEPLAGPRGWLRHHALTWAAAEDLADRAGRAGFAQVTVARHALGRRQLVVVAGRRPPDAA
jgi:ubiquinone/menaquinone biosynthesis C-methylase UbiE